MARIKVEDLPKDMKVSREEMKQVSGGVGQVHDVMLGQYPGTLAGAGLAGSSTQTIVVPPAGPDDDYEEQYFIAPVDRAMKP